MKRQREMEEQPLMVKLISPHAIIPKRATDGSAGYDLASSETTLVPARGRTLVSTGLSIAVPQCCYGRVAPRSSLALKNGIDVGAGVIDSDYRGVVGVVMFNHSDMDFTVCRGDRIAQLILERIETPPVVSVDQLVQTKRADGGFGSTGK